MRILVTGGAGFIGSHLCDALLGESNHVVAVDNLLTGSLDNIAHLRKESRFDFYEHDITEVFDFGAVDYVYNFASPASPVDYQIHGIETLKAGSMGTINALDYALKYNAGFMLASTSECYGDPLVHPQPETYWGNVNTIGPRSVYDEGKRFAEAATAAYLRYRGLKTQIVRIFNTYGPRLQLNDGRVISNFMKQALQGDPLTVYGEGKQTRSFCYVSDEVDGFLRFARNGQPGPMNIGNPGEFTILECAKLVLKVTGSDSKIVYEPLPQDDPKQRCPDISLAKRELGWSPKVNLEQGLKLSMPYFQKVLGKANYSAVK
jgi:dTDP-glucose 4,6-dehydratase